MPLNSALPSAEAIATALPEAAAWGLAVAMKPLPQTSVCRT
jgi:hypothetical protein